MVHLLYYYSSSMTACGIRAGTPSRDERESITGNKDVRWGNVSTSSWLAKVETIGDNSR
jgi:hypothetical protein